MLGVAREIFEKYNFEEEKNIFFEKKKLFSLCSPGYSSVPSKSFRPFGPAVWPAIADI